MRYDAEGVLGVIMTMSLAKYLLQRVSTRNVYIKCNTVFLETVEIGIMIVVLGRLIAD